MQLVYMTNEKWEQNNQDYLKESYEETGFTAGGYAIRKLICGGCGRRYYWPTVLEAFRLDGRERQDELLQQRMTSQEDYDKVSSQLENLRETFDELLSCGVVASKEELNGCNVTGWDAGRIVFLARACCEMGYLSEEEAWRYIGRADALAHETCGSWRELAMSYILGRSLWGGKRAYNSVMKTTADVLLNDPKSPWVRYPW